VVANALESPTETCLRISQQVYDKTSGNVFFVVQLLKALNEDGVLTLSDGAWQLNTDKRLSEDFQALLSTVACIGAELEIKLISSLPPPWDFLLLLRSEGGIDLATIGYNKQLTIKYPDSIALAVTSRLAATCGKNIL
jgi:hypothetical protein